QEASTGGDVEVASCDEVASNGVPAHDGCALPPLGDIGLLIGAGRAGRPTECLDLVEVSRPLRAVERWGASAAELRRALHQERLHPTDPWSRVEDRLPS